MISARYTRGSRLGNQMMQYASLYSLARELDYQLSIPPVEGFSDTLKSPCFKYSFTTSNAPYPLGSRHFLDLAKIREHLGKTITTHDLSYLENIYNFDSYRSELLRIFALPDFDLNTYTMYRGGGTLRQAANVASISKNDLVISLRIGDFVHRSRATRRWRRGVYNRFLGSAYFDIILRQIKFDRLFITSDEPFHPLVSEFLPYDPIIIQNDSPLKTMAFIKRFNRIAISESTYSWWAAYMTGASEIYCPISETGLWGVNTRWNSSESKWGTINGLYVNDKDLYLRVHDDRYKYVHQQSGVIFHHRDAPGRRLKEDFLCA